MQDLKLTLVQAELNWEDIEANLARFEKIVADICEETHLIVLPEMFSTGFSMNTAKAEPMSGSAVHWLLDAARRKGVDIAGSIMIRENNRFYNRLCWADPEGTLHTYDKRHLFRMSGEEKVYTAGDRLLTVEHRGWRIRPFVCYDLRFPAWTRNLDEPYDLAIFVANWPAARALHWKALLQARAIENLCYVAGVNRVGSDGNGLAYSGDTGAYTPRGDVIFSQSQQPCAHTVHLDAADLQAYRSEFPAWKDADQFSLR